MVKYSPSEERKQAQRRTGNVISIIMAVGLFIIFSVFGFVMLRKLVRRWYNKPVDTYDSAEKEGKTALHFGFSPNLQKKQDLRNDPYDNFDEFSCAKYTESAALSHQKFTI